MRKNYTNSRARNLKMNDKVYGLRREVINLIYEAKEVSELPRITVRITENHSSMLACARLKNNILWVSLRAIAEYDLRAIVYHEIAHAVFGAEHNENCPLMKRATNKREKLSKALCQDTLKRISRGRA